MHPRLIIFDADDTLRRTTVPGQPCPHEPHQWELLPGVSARLRALDPSILLAVASNQDHVGYGHLTAEQAHGLLLTMIESAAGRQIDPAGIAFCPHRLDVDCACRKPAPGLLLRLVDHFRVPKEQTLFVGNAPSDRQAAERAGVPFSWAHEFFDYGAHS